MGTGTSQTPLQPFPERACPFFEQYAGSGRQVAVPVSHHPAGFLNVGSDFLE
jgi:hypothetical protein